MIATYEPKARYLDDHVEEEKEERKMSANLKVQQHAITI